MALAELFAIACFISPNPSPLPWIISGSAKDVNTVELALASVPAARLLAKAEAKGVAFARFELPASIRYGEFMGVLIEAQRRRLVVSTPRPLIWSCADGRAQDIGSPWRPVVVGLFGREDGLANAHHAITWPKFFPVRLADGRQGVAFRPSAEETEAYSTFVERAAAGAFDGLQIVVLDHP